MMDLFWDNTVTTLFRCDCEPPVYIPLTEIEKLVWRDRSNAMVVLRGPPLVLYEHIQEGVTLEVLHSHYGLRAAYDPSIVVMRLSNAGDVAKRLVKVIARFPSDSDEVHLEATFTCELEILGGDNP